MNSKRLFQATIVLLSLIYAQFTGAQIISKPDPKVSFDRFKGIIVLVPSMKGSFYLNDYFLTEINGKDTIYLINIKPGEYTAKVVFKTSLIKQNFTIKRGKVNEIRPGTDTLHIKNNAFYYNDITEKAAGKTVFFISRGSYFNITQTALYSFQWPSSSGSSVNNWFRTFTTINGFQIFPGFCTGLGLSYSNYEIPTGYYEINSYMHAKLKNVSFLPVFFDIRAHLSSRRVAPFLKFDIGYNILLSKKSMNVFGFNWGGIPYAYTYKMVGGGIYLSPGIGLRIAVTKLIQLITTVEYSYESSKSMLIEPSQQYSNKYGINCFKFNIGIGFQKRLCNK